MARGNNGQQIFPRNSDFAAFLDALTQVRQRYPFYLYAYALMSNHFHLLLEVIDFSTSRIMQSLFTGYVRPFNATHKHRGHLFQGRYKGIVCDRESYLLELGAIHSSQSGTGRFSEAIGAWHALLTYTACAYPG